jgi:hypothetical protein
MINDASPFVIKKLMLTAFLACSVDIVAVDATLALGR